MSKPTHVNSSSASATAVATSLVVNNPASMSNGDLMLAHGASTGGVISPPAGQGWVNVSRRRVGSSAAGGGQVYAKLAASEPANYTWTNSSNVEWNVIVHAYRPTSGTWASIWDAIVSITWAINDAGTTTPPVPDIPLPTTMDMMLVSFMALGRGSTTTTQPTGYTMAQNPDSGGTGTANTESAGAYKSVTAGSASATTWTVTNSGVCTVAHVALKDPGEPIRRVVRAYEEDANGGAGSTAVGSFTVRMPGCAAGDLLAVYISSNGSTALTAPTGWSLLIQDTVAGVGHTGFWYWRIADGTEPGTFPTWTRTSGTGQYVTTSFAISDATQFGTYTSADDTSSNTTWTFPGLTHAAQSPNAVLLIGWTEGSGSQLMSTYPTGYFGTGRQRTGNAASDILHCCGFKIETGANPASGSFTGAGSITGTGFMLSTATVSYPPFVEAELIA